MATPTLITTIAAAIGRLARDVLGGKFGPVDNLDAKALDEALYRIGKIARDNERHAGEKAPEIAARQREADIAIIEEFAKPRIHHLHGMVGALREAPLVTDDAKGN